MILGTTMESTPEIDIRKNINVRSSNWIWSNKRSPIRDLPGFLKGEIYDVVSFLSQTTNTHTFNYCATKPGNQSEAVVAY